jgi:hypothetical protein
MKKKITGSRLKKWGPYLSERQWGTVREDYSDNVHPGNSARMNQPAVKPGAGAKTELRNTRAITSVYGR